MTVAEEKKRVVTLATRKKMRRSAKKRRHSWQTKKKISAKLYGKRRTPAQIEHYRSAKSGENSPTAKLTVGDVTAIKKLLKTGEVTYRELADEFGLESWQNIRAIDLGYNWKILLTDEEKEAIEEHGKISPGLSPARRKLEKQQ